jgi:hypothetical protein
MNSPRTTPETAPKTRRKAHERVALGLVAAYIHELSDRHDGARNRVASGNGRVAPRAAPCG